MGKIRNKQLSTTVITDIRNFSKTFKSFQNEGSSDFLDFLDNYYACQSVLADVISKDVYMSSTGDGILAIFMGEDHHKDGYAYMLATHRILGDLCEDFINTHPESHISFGMGGDSGNVWDIGGEYLNTYVGTVINRASRIEGTTKLFANTTTAVGNSLYKYLIEEMYPETYAQMVKYETYDSLLNDNPETVLISKEFMLQYVFDMPLKGIDVNAPIFRMSNSLVNNDELYWSVLGKLIDKDKIKKLESILIITEGV